MVRQRRSFENDFKKQVVESILSGSATQAEMAREHRISPVMISPGGRKTTKKESSLKM